MPFLSQATLLDHDSRNPYGIVGTKLADTTDLDEALRLGGLDWTVETHPFVSTIVDPERVEITEDGVTTTPERVQTVESRTRRQVVRRDPNGDVSTLNETVGKSYRVIQNREVGQIAQALVDSSDARWGAIGHTHGGLRTFYQLFFPQDILIGGVDAVNLSLVIQSRHDGGGAVVGVPTGTRLFCTNQFPALRASSVRFSIQHSANAGIKIEELRQAIGLTFKAGEELAAIGEKLFAAKVTSKDALDLIQVIYPIERDKNGEVVEASVIRRQAVRNLYENEQDQANIKGTRWGVFQAVNAYEDWHHPTRLLDKQAAAARRIVARTSDPVKLRATELLLAGV